MHAVIPQSVANVTIFLDILIPNTPLGSAYRVCLSLTVVTDPNIMNEDPPPLLDSTYDESSMHPVGPDKGRQHSICTTMTHGN